MTSRSELEQQLDELLPPDLVDVRRIASRCETTQGELLRLWREDAAEGLEAPRAWPLSARRWRVSLAEFRAWWESREVSQQAELREARRQQTLRELRRRNRQPRRLTPEDAQAMRELRQAAGLGR